ncbi:MAG: nucleoside hydrolase [Pseudomonadota bacterium]
MPFASSTALVRYFLSAFLLATVTLTAAQASARPIIYDTDMAIDDWLGLLYLLAEPSTDVVGITISASGESHCQPGLDNARNLLSLAGKSEVPVACGDDYPLEGFFVFPDPWQVDSDTLSGIDMSQWIDNPVSNTASDGHAVDLIHQIISASPEPVGIVAVGPMTNMAQWLARYPADRERVSELIMMGGSYRAPGNIIVPNITADNPNTVSEWNFYIDPIAAKQTLEADKLAKVMVGLDVTNTVRITHPFADQFKARVSGPVSEFVDQVFDKNRWFIDTKEYYFWDVMAAVVAAQPSLCGGDAIPVTAVAEFAGPSPFLKSSDTSMPKVNAAGGTRLHLAAATAGQVVDAEAGAVTKVCMQTDGDRVFAAFTNALTGYSP